MPPRFLLLFALLTGPVCAHGAPPEPIPDPAATRAAAIEQRRDEVVRQLADCEMGGKTEVARSRYVGPFQFEPRTVVNYVRERDGRTISVQEATVLAGDYGQAATLAKYVIFERGGHGHWPGCSRKLALARQVLEIKAR